MGYNANYNQTVKIGVDIIHFCIYGLVDLIEIVVR